MNVSVIVKVLYRQEHTVRIKQLSPLEVGHSWQPSSVGLLCLRIAVQNELLLKVAQVQILEKQYL